MSYAYYIPKDDSNQSSFPEFTLLDNRTNQPEYYTNLNNQSDLLIEHTNNDFNVPSSLNINLTERKPSKNQSIPHMNTISPNSHSDLLINPQTIPYYIKRKNRKFSKKQRYRNYLKILKDILHLNTPCYQSPEILIHINTDKKDKKIAALLNKLNKKNFGQIELLLNKPPDKRTYEDIGQISIIISTLKYYNYLNNILINESIDKVAIYICMEALFKRVKKEHIIYNINDDYKYFYIILNGNVGLYKPIMSFKLFNNVEYFNFIIGLLYNRDIFILKKVIDDNIKIFPIDKEDIMILDKIIFLLLIDKYCNKDKKEKNITNDEVTNEIIEYILTIYNIKLNNISNDNDENDWENIIKNLKEEVFNYLNENSLLTNIIIDINNTKKQKKKVPKDNSNINTINSPINSNENPILSSNENILSSSDININSQENYQDNIYLLTYLNIKKETYNWILNENDLKKKVIVYEMTLYSKLKNEDDFGYPQISIKGSNDFNNNTINNTINSTINITTSNSPCIYGNKYQETAKSISDCILLALPLPEYSILLNKEKLKKNKKEIDFLHKYFFIFKDIPIEKFSNYFPYFIYEERAKGDIIYKENYRFDYIYFIQEGNISLYSNKSALEIAQLISKIKEKNTQITDKIIYPNLKSNYKDVFDKLKIKKLSKILQYNDREILALDSFYYEFNYLFTAVVDSKICKYYKIHKNNLWNINDNNKTLYNKIESIIGKKMQILYGILCNMNKNNFIVADRNAGYHNELKVNSYLDNGITREYKTLEINRNNVNYVCNKNKGLKKNNSEMFLKGGLRLGGLPPIRNKQSSSNSNSNCNSSKFITSMKELVYRRVNKGKNRSCDNCFNSKLVNKSNNNNFNCNFRYTSELSSSLLHNKSIHNTNSTSKHRNINNLYINNSNVNQINPYYYININNNKINYNPLINKNINNNSFNQKTNQNKNNSFINPIINLDNSYLKNIKNIKNSMSSSININTNCNNLIIKSNYNSYANSIVASPANENIKAKHICSNIKTNTTRATLVKSGSGINALLGNNYKINNIKSKNSVKVNKNEIRTLLGNKEIVEKIQKFELSQINSMLCFNKGDEFLSNNINNINNINIINTDFLNDGSKKDEEGEYLPKHINENNKRMRFIIKRKFQKGEEYHLYKEALKPKVNWNIIDNNKN